MDISIFLAQVFGFYLVIVSLAMIVNTRAYQLMIEEYINNHAVQLLGNVVTLILGILLIITHNLWVADWRVLITLLAWLVFLKGTMNMMFPNWLATMGKVMQKSTYYFMSSIISCFLGIFLLYHGMVLSI